MKKALKWIGIVFVVLVIISLIGGSDSNKNKSQTNSTSSNTTIEGTKPTPEEKPISPKNIAMAELIADFDKNQLSAEETYKDKFIQTTGYISNIAEDILGNPFLSLKPTTEEYYFGTAVQCLFKEKSELTSLENGQQVTVTGTVKTQSLGIISVDSCNVVK